MTLRILLTAFSLIAVWVACFYTGYSARWTQSKTKAVKLPVAAVKKNAEQKLIQRELIESRVITTKLQQQSSRQASKPHVLGITDGIESLPAAAPADMPAPSGDDIFLWEKPVVMPAAFAELPANGQIIEGQPATPEQLDAIDMIRENFIAALSSNSADAAQKRIASDHSMAINNFSQPTSIYSAASANQNPSPILNQPAADPADPEYRNRWVQEQPSADEVFRAKFGDVAYSYWLLHSQQAQ